MSEDIQLLSFQFNSCTIKSFAHEDYLSQRPLFQFNSCTIKSGNFLAVAICLSNFNSTLVRLKAFYIYLLLI